MADELTQPADFTYSLQFGGGLNTAQPEDQINDREAAGGDNFDIDIVGGELKMRAGYDLVGTVPNGSPIYGGISLLKSDGTVQTAFQAGDKVYEWDGTTTFTEIGTVSSDARLRGRLEHNFPLTDKIFITDLGLQEPVKEWDGTTFQNMPENLAGDFIAKYCFVDNERAHFANVISNSVATPHVIVGSERGDNEVLTVTDRPSSALNAQDPFFLPALDLSPITGFVGAFGQLVIATTNSTQILSGTDAQDFFMKRLASRVKASGAESLVFIGDDVVLGRQGKIESISDTDKFGDVEVNDLTNFVKEDVKTFTNWTSVYNSRTDRGFFFPESQSQVWVMEKSLLGTGISPWMRWKTEHSLDFNPTFTMNMLDPDDGLEYIFMGDSSGNVYRLEGTNSDGDAGAEISLRHLSKLISVPVDLQTYSHEAELRYRNNQPADIDLTYKFTGLEQFDSNVTIEVEGIQDRTVYNGNKYYNNGEYYGTPGKNQLIRQIYEPAGQANEFQIQIGYEEKTAPAINAVIGRFEAVNQ